MKKTVLVYGLLGGVLIAPLKLVEYRYLRLEHTLEIYGGIVALMFTVVGIWLGQKLTRERIVTREVAVRVEARSRAASRSSATRPRSRHWGSRPRELDILEAGLIP